ncbi:MAG: hypothetical protein ABI861_07240 [Panacibacter sp.]
MRAIIIMVIMFSAAALKAQTVVPGSFRDYTRVAGFANSLPLNDGLAQKKWSLSRFSGISTSFAFFKGGNATVVAAPIGLQLSRRLNDNLYAFANVSVAPAYINFNRSFINTDLNKANQGNGYYGSNSFGVYSSASLGLMYINNDRTFSISGSISVERSNYPLLPYYPINNTKTNPVLLPNR